jgi:acyl-coenzyme A thioesterase PaaI-like protein
MSAQPLDPLLFGSEQPCFGCSPNHPAGLRLTFAREGDEVVTRFVPGERYQGPPGIMHGGLVMTAADELAAWTLIGLRERFGFTTSAELKLSRAVRIGREVTGRGRILKESARIVRVHVVLSQEDAVAAQGELSFVLLDEGAASKLLGMPLPEAWKRFCRNPS